SPRSRTHAHPAVTPPLPCPTPESSTSTATADRGGADRSRLEARARARGPLRRAARASRAANADERRFLAAFRPSNGPSDPLGYAGSAGVRSGTRGGSAGTSSEVGVGADGPEGWAEEREPREAGRAEGREGRAPRERAARVPLREPGGRRYVRAAPRDQGPGADRVLGLVARRARDLLHALRRHRRRGAQLVRASRLLPRQRRDDRLRVGGVPRRGARLRVGRRHPDAQERALAGAATVRRAVPV